MENPGTDIAQTITGLAHHLGEAGDLPLHQLVDSLVRHTRRTGRHTDDIALLLLRPTAPLSHEPTGSTAPAPHIWSSGQT